MVATTDQKARLLDLITGVLELVRDGKRSPDEVCDVLQIIKNDRDFALILGTNTKKMTSESSFTISVNYGQTVEEMVAAGNFDWKNPDINSKNFPIRSKGQQELELRLIHLNRQISSDDAIKELDKMGFRPAKLPELLAFGAKHPEEQRKYPIIALGSVWQDSGGHRDVLVLWRDGSGRGLGLYWFESDWDPDDRFLAVRK